MVALVARAVVPGSNGRIGNVFILNWNIQSISILVYFIMHGAELCIKPHICSNINVISSQL